MFPQFQTDTTEPSGDRRIHELSVTSALAGEGSLFERVQFSPDGTLLVAINSQGKAHLWRAPSPDDIEKLQGANR